MKILIIPYNYPSGEKPQCAIFIADQVKALREHGHQVDVLGTIPKTLSDIFSAKSLRFGQLSEERWLLCVPAIRGLEVFNKLIRLTLGKWLFKRYLKNQSKSHNFPDIIHVHNSSVADLAIWIKRCYGISYVITEHSSLLWDGNLLTPKEFNAKKKAYQNSQANVAVSENFAKHLANVFAVPFTYIPNIVDTDYFTLKREAKEFRSNHTAKHRTIPIRLVSVGNLTTNKNHQLAIYAMKELIDNKIDVTLHIAGHGAEMNNLKALIKKLELGSQVSLLGQLTRVEIRKLLHSSDFFLLPSKKETFGVVLIEAMATGMPVLALKNGGSESIVNPSVGMLVDSDESFKSNLPKFLMSPFDSLNINEYAIQNFSSTKIVNQLIKLYSHKEY